MDKRKGRIEGRRKEGRKGERTELEDGRREKRDRIEEMHPVPCFPHGLKEISMEFLDQHLLCTLWGGGQEKAYVLYACENVDNYGRPLSVII